MSGVKESIFSTVLDTLEHVHFNHITIMITSVIVLFFRSLIFRKRNVSVKLFSTALKSENNGNFEEALTNYEAALAEVARARHNKSFKVKIIEKISILHTVIQYQKNIFNLRKDVY